MVTAHADSLSCPDPLARAPRACAGSEASTTALRLTHFPASPMVTLSLYRGMAPGLVKRGRQGPDWRPFGARVVIAGTQAHPTVSWAPTTGCGHVAIFNADAAQALFDIDPAAIQDRFVPVGEVVKEQWTSLWADLLASEGADMLAVLERHLAPRWQALQGRPAAQPSLRQLGRLWV